MVSVVAVMVCYEIPERTEETHDIFETLLPI
jgi:hypothetical protein